MEKSNIVSSALIVLLVFSFVGSVYFVSGQQTITTVPVQVELLRSNIDEDHIYLNPQQSVTYSSSEPPSGFQFASLNVELNTTNQDFLKQLNTDLYVQSYNYFGSFGGWTSKSNFTLTNPTAQTQELFLKIQTNYIQINYALDTEAGKTHTIEFNSSSAADRVFVRWGFFAALSLVVINGSTLDLSTINQKTSQVRVEFLPTYLSFQTPPQRIQATHFKLTIEERDIQPPSGYCYISALLLNHSDVTLNPNQQVLFTIPKVDGWTFNTVAAYTNLTASFYPQPYPFQLVNMSIWEANGIPLLVTALDTTFGVKNISNQTYSVGFDLLFYYWENQTALVFNHEIAATDVTSIRHRIEANISTATVGSEKGLTGQYLRFQVPGTTVSFDAPDPVGKYEGSYIPLRQGNYTLVTMENRIETNITSVADDLGFTNTLQIHVTYNGDPFANAQVNVTQTGNEQAYTATTDQNGNAQIVIHSNFGFNQIIVKVSKDLYNYVQNTVSYFAGFTLIIIAIVVAFALVITVIMLRRKRLIQNDLAKSFQRR
jgi:hypothetical protein